MSANTEQALARLREVRAAIFVESGCVDEINIADELAQMDKLEEIQEMINKVETAIKEYN